MREEYERLNPICKYFNESSDDIDPDALDLVSVTVDTVTDSRYDENNACRAVRQLIRNNLTWAGKFCAPCNQDPPDFLDLLEKRWRRIERDLRSRLPTELCERNPPLPTIGPYGG